jgi:protein SCO1/2
MNQRTAILATIFAGFSVFAGAGAVIYLNTPRTCGGTPLAAGSSVLGGPISLVSETGAQVTEAEIFDKPALVYFGYTYCPDVCPLDTARNSDVVERLLEQGYDLRHVFITIDPMRDTPEVLAEYTSYFDETMLGLTGTEQQIIDAAKAYRVYFAKNGEGEDYLMDHLSLTYLVDTNGDVAEIFRRDIPTEQLAESVGCHIGLMS